MKTWLNVALPKGRLGEKVYSMFAKAGFECPEILESSRKLIFENEECGVRYFWVKPSDVAIYVERGAADIGVAGKDILLEYRPDVYELFDLDIGKCKMAVEWTAVAIDWLLGGSVGIGTLISAFGGGFFADIVFRLFSFDPRNVNHETLTQSLAHIAKK